MTEKINLQQLRAQAMNHPRSWPQDALLALIDLAEAAHELRPWAPTLTSPEFRRLHASLRDALDKFDHT